MLCVAHALRPTEDEVTRFSSALKATRVNIESAKMWVAWLRKTFPDVTFPWMNPVYDHVDDSQHEAWLRDACAATERCDGVVLCGDRVSSEMESQVRHGQERRPRHGGASFGVYDLTGRDVSVRALRGLSALDATSAAAERAS